MAPPNPFMMHPRYPMPPPSGLHLTINGGDANNSELIDSTNLTPDSPVATGKKSKKSLKKKTTTTTTKEEV